MAGDNKSESATPRRRSEARKKGQAPKSPDLSSLIVLFGLILSMPALANRDGFMFYSYFHQIFSHLGRMELVTPELVMQIMGHLFLTSLELISPILILAMGLGIAVNMAQTGPMFALQKLMPDINRLNPLNGLQRFFSANSLVELIKSIIKLGLAGYLCYTAINNAYPLLILLPGAAPQVGLSIVLDTAYHMALRVVTVMLVMGAIDYGYQRYAYEKSLRMSKDEVKQEHKQLEGNPMVKGRIRSRQRQIAQKRMMAAVPAADVVITNPTHFAIALKYDSDAMSAPVVVAKGQDLIALKIRAVAMENDVPIVENPPLARTIYKQVPLDREIPADLYAAVAEVLAYVYKINEKRKARSGGLSLQTGR